MTCFHTSDVRCSNCAPFFGVKDTSDYAPSIPFPMPKQHMGCDACVRLSDTIHTMAATIRGMSSTIASLVHDAGKRGTS